MKKFISVLLVAAILTAFASVPASAATYFSVTVENSDAKVAVGEKLELIVTVGGVSNDKNLAAVEFNISYNPNYLKPLYSQTDASDATRFTETPSGSAWEHILTDKGTSFYCFFSPKDGGTDDSTCISAGDKLSFVLIFEVLSEANGHTVNIGINSAVGYDSDDLALETPLSGAVTGYSFSAELPAKPIANIGASINVLDPAIRLGARYKSAYLGSLSADDIKSLGILYCPTEALGNAELTESVSGAVKLGATLEGNFSMSKIAQYDEVVFYITIRNIPADELDKEYSFRGALTTDSGETVLTDATCTRSYSYVYDTLFPAIGTAPGDNVVYPGTGWFE